MFLGSIYIGGTSGGLISSILLGIPGTPSSVATVYDGYPMTLKGQAVKALGIGIFSSFVGTFLSVIVAILFCPVLAKFAVKLGPWEIFSLCFCAIILVVTISKGDMFNGLIAALIGFLVSSIGFSPIDGAKRFSYGINGILSGVDTTALVLGLFAISSVMANYAKKQMVTPEVTTKNIHGIGISLKEIFSYRLLIIKSFFIGLWIGFLPGMGSGLSNQVAYASAKSSSKHPEEFGKGSPEGVFAPEVANNASVGGAIIPMIALGIPGDTPTSIMLGGLMIFGIQAGPMMMTNNALFVYVFFGVLLLAAILTFAIQFLGIRTFPSILRIPYHYLFSGITVLCFIGSFSTTMSIFNCILMLVFGVVGVFFAFAKLPSAPFILGFILGPMLEINLRKGLTYTTDGFLPFITRPISGILLFTAAASLFWPVIRKRLEEKKTKAA
jgi:putative tricarboxylic transport membrane protein